MGEFTLESPFIDLTLNHVPKHWKAILAAWMAFWLVVCLALIYLYAVVLPDFVGFETALLVGVALLIGAAGD